PKRGANRRAPVNVRKTAREIPGRCSKQIIGESAPEIRGLSFFLRVCRPAVVHRSVLRRQADSLIRLCVSPDPHQGQKARLVDPCSRSKKLPERLFGWKEADHLAVAAQSSFSGYRRSVRLRFLAEWFHRQALQSFSLFPSVSFPARSSLRDSSQAHSLPERHQIGRRGDFYLLCPVFWIRASVTFQFHCRLQAKPSLPVEVYQHVCFSFFHPQEIPGLFRVKSSR